MAQNGKADALLRAFPRYNFDEWQQRHAGDMSKPSLPVPRSARRDEAQVRDQQDALFPSPPVIAFACVLHILFDVPGFLAGAVHALSAYVAGSLLPSGGCARSPPAASGPSC